MKQIGRLLFMMRFHDPLHTRLLEYYYYYEGERISQNPDEHTSQGPHINCMDGRKHRLFMRCCSIQLEQGRATWEDQEVTLSVCQALVWHLATTHTITVSTSAPHPGKRQNRLAFTYNAPAKPGTNQGLCTDG